MTQTARIPVVPRRKARIAPRMAANNGEPLYQQLVAALKREIVRGDYPLGTRLPTEAGLCRRFKVSRHTVRQALRQLRDAGLVVSRQGAGTTVIAPERSGEYVHSVASIEELIPYASENRYDVDGSGPVTCDAKLARRLNCRQGEQWWRICGFRHAPNQVAPICWTEVYIRPQFSGVTRMIARRKGAIYAWIEDMYGERIAEVQQSLRARPVPRELAQKLGVDPGSTVVEICRSYRLTTGAVAEIAFNLHPADRFSYAMTLRRRGA